MIVRNLRNERFNMGEKEIKAIAYCFLLLSFIICLVGWILSTQDGGWQSDFLFILTIIDGTILLFWILITKLGEDAPK